MDTIKQIKKLFDNNKLEAAALLEEVINPNRCKDHGSQLKTIQKQLLEQKLSGLVIAKDLIGAYAKISPGYAAIQLFEADLKILLENL